MATFLWSQCWVGVCLETPGFPSALQQLLARASPATCQWLRVSLPRCSCSSFTCAGAAPGGQDRPELAGLLPGLVRRNERWGRNRQCEEEPAVRPGGRRGDGHRVRSPCSLPSPAPGSCPGCPGQTPGVPEESSGAATRPAQPACEGLRVLLGVKRLC